MTTTAADPNRGHWEATARDEETDWGALATEPDGIDEERVDDPAGLWLRPPDALAGAAVLAGANSRDPLAAALHADAHGLPPTYLQVGADEALLDDSKRLAGHLRDAGVDLRFDEFAGQLHTFQMAAGERPLPTTRSGGPGRGCARQWVRERIRRSISCAAR